MYVDKRLAGIQAVQTLSRLNRAHPGKDTTYILDFVNDPDEVLAAFRSYYDKTYARHAETRWARRFAGTPDGTALAAC
jgi:type I site-specific restriction-modification system R (restriction) subunit